MILGNKCDMDDKRQVSKERGQQVSQFIAEYRYKMFGARKGFCAMGREMLSDKCPKNNQFLVIDF